MALVDVRMPVMDGIGAAGLITARYATKVLILTTFDLGEHVFDVIRSGASGFLLEGITAEGLGRGDREVARCGALRKLELRDRIQAVVFAYENGLAIRGE